MKFPMKQTGMRFFFFTFGVEGRREALSRLVRGEKRPVLSEAGERVREVWAGLHGMEAAFTASEWVLMPDHAHLLLVVRPGAGREVAFNPLVFAHWFLWATETAAGGGAIVGPPGGRWDRYVSVGEWSAPAVRLWEREWWVDVALGSRQLGAIRRYIRGNVARRWWKVDHPDRFALRRLRHPVLEPAVAWSGMGDATLLSNPFLYHVRLSRSAPPGSPAGDAGIERCLGLAARGWVPVCGFLSEAEREFGRRLKALPRSRWVRMAPYGLPARYDPSLEDSRWLAEGRLLVLSPFGAEEREPWKVTREGCLAMNARAAGLCGRAAELAGRGR